LLSTKNWFFFQTPDDTTLVIMDDIVKGRIMLKLLANSNLIAALDNYEHEKYEDIDGDDLMKKVRALKPSKQPTKIRTVQKVYGLENQSEKDRVVFVQETFLYSKTQTIQASHLIDNFPVNESNIKRHFVDLEAKKDGQSKMRRKTFRKPKISYAPIIVEDEDDYQFDFSKDDKVHHVVGEQVGSDQLGPYKGHCGMIYVDRASGFIVCYFNKKDSIKKTIHQKSINTKKISSYYKTYQHQIKTLNTDAHSLYIGSRNMYFRRNHSASFTTRCTSTQWFG
jgi:hypothetical protein